VSIISEHPTVFAAIVALLPAAASWLSGLTLARRVEDRSLPERLLLQRRWNGVAMALAFITIGIVTPASLLWAGPLLFTGLLLAAYPLRRTLFEETWTARGYLSFFHRLTFAVFGFFAALGAMPFVAALAGSFDWLAGAAMAAILIAWERHYGRIVRRSLRATPLEEGPVLDRCRALAETCGMPQPEYVRVDLEGGAVANALALPSLQGNAVLFTDTLLERLSGDEMAAICAHELAHFEYFTPRRLRHLRAASLTLIAAAALVSPLSRLSGLGDSTLPPLVWFAALAATLAARARDKQRQETICDQRAVGLLGDGEPLIAALTKLYAISRIPRRIETRQEHAGSHPSLSRRIRDIRRAAGTAPAPLSAPVTIASGDGYATVTFDKETLHWVEQAGVAHVVSYGHLTELRLEPYGRRGPRLRASTGAAKTWTMAIAATDIGRVQDVLDRVDGQLADTPAPRGVLPGSGRLFAMFASMLALSLGQIVVSMLALLAWLIPAPQLLSAAGVAALAAAALTLRDRPGSGMLGVALVMAAAGLVLMWLSRSARHQPGRNPRPLVAALGLFAVVLFASLGIGGADAIHLHMAARGTPAVIVVWLAVASALATSPRSTAKRGSLVAALIAVAATAISSQSFLDFFGRDPFLVESQRLQWVVVDADGAEEYEIPQTTSGIQLSPSGLKIAALQQSETEDAAPTFQVGLPGDGLSPLSGDDLQFFDDDTLIMLDTDGSGSALRQVRIEPPHQEVWRQLVPQLRGGTLSIARGTGHWRMNGFDKDEAIVRAEGTIGTRELRLRRWPARYTRDAWIEAVTTDGRDPLVVESSYDNGLFEYLPSRAQAIGVLLNAGNRRSRYWSIGDAGVTALGRSQFGASCASGLSDGALACSFYDSTRTRFVRLDPGGAVTGLGWVDGRFITQGEIVEGWLIGWAESTAVAVDLVNGRILRVPRSEGVVGHLTVSGGRLAAVVFNRGTCRLRIYDIEPAGNGRFASTSSAPPRPAPQQRPASSAPRSARDGSPRR
jgi:Zn-dependent protease with chaperone function